MLLSSRAPVISSLALLALASLAAAGCERRERQPKDDDGADGGSVDEDLDGGVLDGGDGGEGEDGGVAEADIRETLACGTPAGITGNGQPGELQLHAIDTTTFPDALCNDGSGPVLYYRPHRGDANRDRWVITLRGGGGCSSAATCAARWCSCDSEARCPFAEATTNFSLENMSGGGRRGRAGSGVMLRDGPLDNPIEDYNHVQLIYCSSDQWQGNVRGLTFTTTHPRTGEEVSYTLHFLGQKILEADLTVLRQEGVAPLVYTLDGSAIPMPDLDEAQEVVLVGDSAGGAGVIQQLDAVRDLLRAHHEGCDGGPACPPEVVGIIDAIVGPDMSRLDFTNFIGAEAGIDTYGEFTSAVEASPANQDASRDTSCLAWHQQNRPGTEGECGDLSHVVRHHITSPFFVRMALLDSLISANYEELGLADPVLGPFVDDDQGIPRVFAEVLQEELTDFPGLPTAAEEGEEMSVPPGVFAPACANHDTIHDDNEVFGVTIDPTGSDPTRFFDVYSQWRAGVTPSALLSTDPQRADTVCP